MLAEQVIKDTLYDDIMQAFKGLPSAEKADQYWDIINSNARNIIRQVQFADGQLDENERSKGCLITDLLFDMSDAIYDIKESEKARIQERAKRDAEIELEKLSQKEEKKKKKQERRQKVKDFFQWHPKLKKFLIWTCVLSILILTGTILIRNFLDRTNLKYREVTGGYEVYCAPSYQSDLELVIPKTYNGKNVVAIAENGFTNQDDIISVVIPDTVKTIGKKAFYNCNKLSKVTLPNNLLKIEDSAFQKTALTEVTIPSSLSYVGKYAFADCEILKNVLVENSLDLMAGWSKEWKGDSAVLLDVFYNITFDCSGIETKISTLILKPGEQIVFEVPTKAGYQFLCWNNGQYNVSDSEGHLIATINSSCTLSPVWKANLNTVKFNANGGTGTMDEINVHTDESISLSRCLFKREGCIFLGWSDTAKGDKKWNDQQLFTMGSSSSYTLYAVWLPYTSTIVFNSESGKRNQLITDSAFYDEVVNFGMDIEKLKSFGYTAFTVSVTLECCEIDDGNQLLYVKDPKQGEVEYFRIEHGPNTLDTSWGSHTVDFTVLFDKLANNSKYYDHFIFRWGASGLFDDDWMLGTTTIVITAIK